MKKLIALPLAVMAALPAFAADEEWTVGSNTWQVERTATELCPGVTYTLVNWKENRSSTYPGSRLHVIEADLTKPGVAVENVKIPGQMTGNRTLVDHAKAIHKDGKQAVAGANANFWITSPEKGNYACMGTQPHGVCIADGVMYTEPNVMSFAHCGGPINATGLLAFDQNGKAYLDYLKPQNPDISNPKEGSGFQWSAVNNRIGHLLTLDMCNRYVNYNCASIYTPVYGRDKKFRVGDLIDMANGPWVENFGVPGTTGQSNGYLEVLLDFADGTSAMNVGAATDYIIKEIRYYAPNTEATVGCLGNHDLAIVGRNLYAQVPGQHWKVGDSVTLNTKLNFVSQGSPERVVNAISGNILAMKGGVIADAAKTDGYNKSYNERTVYATNDEGTKLWILTCEHNAKNPTRYFGFSLEQLCIMARDKFGASNLTQVDCGGSAQMYANGKQVSASYDANGTRAVYNALFVTYSGNDAKLNEPGYEEPEPEPDPDADWKDSGERAHYSYNLSKTEGEGAPVVGYTLTGDVKDVRIVLTNLADSKDVVEIAGGVAAGRNEVAIDDPRLKEGARYKWSVKVESNPVSGTSHFFHDAPSKLDARGGVGIVTDPESPAYGKVITSMGYAQGFGLYSQDLVKEGVYHAGMAPLNAGNRSDLYRIGMRNRNTAYACAFSDAGAGYWKFDPLDPEAAPENLAGGENDGTGCFKMPGSDTCVGSGASGITFHGEGDQQSLWVFAEDWPSGNNSQYKGIVCRWIVGNNDKITYGVQSASANFSGTGRLANQNVCLTPAKGGIFAAQHRGQGSNSIGCPGFIYLDNNLDEIVNSGFYTHLFNSCGGSVAVSDDQTLFAVSGYNENIKVFDLTWEDYMPSFKLKAIVNDTKHVSEVSQLAFDPAGNLYAWQRSSNEAYAGLFGYSWKNEKPVAVTPAKAADAITAKAFTGIMTVEGPARATRWFTLQGIETAADALVPGIYIKVTGGKSEKVAIK